MDPIVGSSQKCDAFWKRIRAHYNDECDGPDRTQMDLNNRWTVIDEAVLKFSGCYQRTHYTKFNAALEEKTIQDNRAEFDRLFQGPMDNEAMAVDMSK
ncbi:hypothetical protein MFLAVUS_005312 [Mucor flavus]|uniref:Uncharacterized protein n=1 Tax=Mucor flavus TaxID=439312 RepID=A0ABP9YYE8_9FUNG